MGLFNWKKKKEVKGQQEHTGNAAKDHRSNLDLCIFSQQPVLELRGQFEKLDTYYLEKKDELFRKKIYGSCYSAAMKKSEWGALWYKQRMQYARKMGYRVMSMAGNHCVVDQGQALEVYYADGTRAYLGRDEIPQSGNHITINQHYNLELNDVARVAAIREKLEQEGSYPLWKLIEHLGVQDQILEPAQLQNALAYAQDPAAAPVGNWLGLKLVYDYHLPPEILKVLG